MAPVPPKKHDLSLLQPGIYRGRLIDDFGEPIRMEIRDGIRRDLFRFWQGTRTGSPPPGALTDGMLNVATLGHWQETGSAEGSRYDGHEIMAEVTYDRDDYVVMVEPLRGPPGFVQDGPLAQK